MQNKEFVQHLIQKLKTGNRASIHLNALPLNYITRLDLNRLATLTNENGTCVFAEKNDRMPLSLEFLENLMNKAAFNFDINLWQTRRLSLTEEQAEKLNYLAKRMDSIYYQSVDNYQESGIKTFGFGFPLLIKRDRTDSSKIIKAPLLIWQLEIEKSNKIPNCWTIKKQDDYPIAINEILVSHLWSDENIELNSIPEEYLEDSIIQQEELLELCNTILNQINASEKKTDTIRIEPCPSAKQLDETLGKETYIQWSGVFGIYKSQKQSVLKELEWLVEHIETFKNEQFPNPEFESKIACVDTDPSQEQIIDKFVDSAIKVIQGPPGTGKSQTLTAIIANAIENKKKCLVVCEKKTAIEVIYNNLNAIGLGNLTALIDDINKDRERIIKQARSKIEDVIQPDFQLHEYKRCIEKCEELKKQINRKVEKFTKPCFGDYNHKEMVGLYLENQLIASSREIGKMIGNETFQFNYNEYHDLLEIVNQSISMTNREDLELIKDDFFLNQPSENEKEMVLGQLHELLLLCKNQENLVDEFIQFTDNKYDKKSFSNNLISSFLGLFDNRLKQINKQKTQIWKNYIQISSVHHQIEVLIEPIKRFEDFKRYTNLKSYLIILVFRLENCINNFQYFWQYREWLQFIYSQPLATQKLIRTIAKLPFEKRGPAFRSWYLDRCLANIYKKENLQEVYDDLCRFQEYKSKLRILQIERIKSYWEFTHQLSVQKYKMKQGNVRQLYNFRRNKDFGRKNALRKIIDADFELFTDFFPVILTNPVSCSSVLPLKPNLFDIVIFDEASQLRVEDTYTAYLRGKFRIITGDRHQMPPSSYFQGAHAQISTDSDDDFEESVFLAESESLLEFAEENATQQTYLEFHYRSQHPSLIDFSNAAFYGNRLVPMPNLTNSQAIHFIEANGIYDKSVNDIEAEEVVNILADRVQPLSNGQMPTVGVATLNLYQRNLIWDKITERAFTDEEFSRKFARINANGFFVKNLENIQGDERDIIIISTTFGPDLKGSFRQNFGPINQANGYRLLNVIITRAKREMFVCSSIPPAIFLNFRHLIEENGNTGRGIFYAYLSYAHAIENQNSLEKQNILDFVSSHCKEGNSGKYGKKVAGTFENAIKKYLEQHIDKERIKSPFPFGGLCIETVIQSTDESLKSIAFECNGGQNFKNDQAYIHLEYRKKLMEKYGFEYVYLWSLKFWRDTEKSFADLLNKVR